MIAFQFPPMVGSSGMQRTLNFSNYLVDHGWRPTVVTVTPIAHERVRNDQLGQISKGVEVIRTWAVDAARHLSVRGRYLDAFARPDRWANWMLSAVPFGVLRVTRQRFDVIWSTYPISTAHCIGHALHRASGLPWVSDFRDMMIDDVFPEDGRTRANYRRIEARTVKHSRNVVVTTPGTRDLYIERYPDAEPGKIVCIENGFDEDNFRSIEIGLRYKKRVKLRLVHSGSLHPSERDPSCFFKALASLQDENYFEKRPVHVTLRATGFDSHHAVLLGELGIDTIVSLEPGIAYADALREMMLADGLLLFQAANCNRQVPAKIYEYFRAKRPILAITDPAGDTARTMNDAGLFDVGRIDDVEHLKCAFKSFVEKIQTGISEVVAEDVASRFTRRNQAAALAAILENILPKPK